MSKKLLLGYEEVHCLLGVKSLSLVGVSIMVQRQREGESGTSALWATLKVWIFILKSMGSH